MRAKPTPQPDDYRERAVAMFHWLGVSDVVQQLGTRPNGRPVASDSTVREWIRSGRLKARDFGTGKKPLYRIKPEWLLEAVGDAPKDAA